MAELTVVDKVNRVMQVVPFVRKYFPSAIHVELGMWMRKIRITHQQKAQTVKAQN